MVEVNERERVFQILTSSRGARNMKFERYQDRELPRRGGECARNFSRILWRGVEKKVFLLQ